MMMLCVICTATHAQFNKAEFKHRISAYVGNEYDIDFETGSIAFGLEYEYRFNRFQALGITGEYTPDRQKLTIGIPLWLHATQGLKMSIGPILSSYDVDIGEGVEETQTHLGARGSFGYDFFIGPVNIGPAVKMDMVAEDLFFHLGANVGVSF